MQVVNVERDVAAVAEGRGSELIYSGLTGVAQVAALSDKKAAAAAAAAVQAQRASANDLACATGIKPFDGAVFAAPLLPKGAAAATPGGAVARLLEKLKLAAPAAAAAAMSDDDDDDDDDDEEEEEEIVMRVTVGGGDCGGDEGNESGSGGDDDADVLQSSAMGTVGGWGSAALSEKDKLTAARAAPHAAAAASIPTAATAATDGASSGSSCDGSSDSCDDDAAGPRGLDTSAGIPEGMTKAEWKKKVKEEKREKRKTKIPVRAIDSVLLGVRLVCFDFVVIHSAETSEKEGRKRRQNQEEVVQAVNRAKQRQSRPVSVFVQAAALRRVTLAPRSQRQQMSALGATVASVNDRYFAIY